MQRDVKVHARNLNKNGLVSQRSILAFLLKDLFKEKASEDHGYFLAVTSLKSIGKGDMDESGNIVFTVAFTCRIFKLFKGEVLQGVVLYISQHGVFLRCGHVNEWLYSKIYCVFNSRHGFPSYEDMILGNASSICVYI